MTDEREPLDPSTQAAVIGAGFAGALLGGAVVWCLQAFRAGDEPPIRVKGGSLSLDLSGGTWKKRGSGEQKWKISHGTRGKEEYDVAIVASGTGCMEKAPKGKTVRVEYTEGKTVRWVEIKAPGRNTRVDASDPLTLTNGGQTLMWGGTGYVSRIEVDSQVCTFGPSEFTQAYLADF